jgi:cell shape-determining protein MreD
MKKFCYIIIFLLAAILQTSVISLLFDSKSLVSAVLMLVLAFSVLDGFFGFLWWAVFYGIFYDLISYSRIGINVLIFLGTVYFVSFFSRRFTVEFRGVGIFLFLFFVVVVSFFSHFVLVGEPLIFEAHSLRGVYNIFGSLGSIAFEIFVNCLLFIGFFNVIKKMKAYFSLETL